MPSLKIGHVPRYGELARLLVAHRDALRRGEEPETPETVADAEELVRQLEAMGPTFVKLGQLLSSRVDLLPAAYTEALRRLQDQAEPLPFDVVRQVLEEELGARLGSVFADIDETAIGSASLAQVHRATLHDGRTVAVKVQRPGVRARILEDMDVISELASTVDEHVGAAQRAGLAAMVQQFRRALLDELDYRHEATNLRMLAEFVESYGRLVTPVPVDELSGARVLTMTLMEGENVASLHPGDVPATEGKLLVEQLFEAYLDQVLVHGTFHADPHPGNVVLTFDRCLALIDVGMTARVSPDLRDALLRMLVALEEGRGTAVAAALERAGERLEDFDRDALRRDVSALVLEVRGVGMDQMEVGRELAELARISVQSGLRPAPELSMIGKALLNLDDVARRLAPTYEPTSAIREHTASLMRHQLLEAASPTNAVSAALDAKEFAERLPERMNKVLDTLAEGPVRISVEGMDEAEIMRSVQKLANRAAAGLAVAAFVLAAAIFSVSTHGPRWGGLSAFTVVLLALAAALGAAIVVATLRHDLPQRRGRRRARY